VHIPKANKVSANSFVILTDWTSLEGCPKYVVICDDNKLDFTRVSVQ
jgi:hypothetical protein